jgi:hypothetical protein
MPYTYKLILTSGPDAGTEIPLEKDELFLGREATNDIVINDVEVSRKHARLLKQGDDYFYDDLGSTNGSFILGQKITAPTLLKPENKITIGEKVEFTYYMTSIDPTATMVSRRKPSAPVSEAPVQLPPPVMVAPPAIPPQPAQKKPAVKLSKPVMILLIVIAAIFVLCVIPSIIMEASDTWCNVLGWFFNFLKAGSCIL